MWEMVRGLRERGVTIILTTHYIEEAEEMADRIGVINKGELMVVEEKTALMRKLGKKQLTLHLQNALTRSRPGWPTTAGAREGRRRTGLHLRTQAAGRHRHAAAPAQRTGIDFKDLHTTESSLEDIFVSLVGRAMNLHAIRAIYTFEMSRTFRTIFQSIATPVITTSLYFVVFGAIGSRMVSIDGVSYGAFIVPGLIMLTVLTESLNNASFGIYMPKFAGTIYEMLSAPVSFVEVLAGYVGAAATKSVMLGAIILVTARLFVPFEIQHPFAMVVFLILTSVTFSLLGFAIGIWADSWEKTSIVPTLIVTPLTFLGGSFYSLSMLPPVWQRSRCSTRWCT